VPFKDESDEDKEETAAISKEEAAVITNEEAAAISKEAKDDNKVSTPAGTSSDTPREVEDVTPPIKKEDLPPKALTKPNKTKIRFSVPAHGTQLRFMFIPKENVPVLGTWLPNLRKFFEPFQIFKVEADKNGYFAYFDISQSEAQCQECWQTCQGQKSLKYTLDIKKNFGEDHLIELSVPEAGTSTMTSASNNAAKITPQQKERRDLAHIDEEQRQYERRCDIIRNRESPEAKWTPGLVQQMRRLSNPFLWIPRGSMTMSQRRIPELARLLHHHPWTRILGTTTGLAIEFEDSDDGRDDANHCLRNIKNARYRLDRCNFDCYTRF
jgi:hypothetical protein